MTFRKIPFILLLLCALCLPAFGSLRAAEEDLQPHMDEALHFLQDAKKAGDPLPLLHSAREALEKAAHNKHGYREVAMGLVDRAIDEAQAGSTQNMINKINAAIAQIHTAMFKAPGRR